jgi:CBS domain-containing protein
MRKGLGIALPPRNGDGLMQTTPATLMELTAGDLMTADVLQFNRDMPLRDAARMLIHNRISGAPVVDENGKCIGVISATDFLRQAGLDTGAAQAKSVDLPLTCSFQTKFRDTTGEESILCTLPLGVCPIQRRYKDAKGGDHVSCSQPHSVPVDWQVVEVEKLPVDAVHRYMTADPVTVDRTASIRTLARMMVDAHIHRLMVVDEARKPIGVVSASDLIAAIAYSAG